MFSSKMEEVVYYYEVALYKDTIIFVIINYCSSQVILMTQIFLFFRKVASDHERDFFPNGLVIY